MSDTVIKVENLSKSYMISRLVRFSAFTLASYPASQLTQMVNYRKHFLRKNIDAY